MKKQNTTIVRIVRHTKPFTTLDNSLLQNPNLSYAELGMLVYLLSRPSNWTVRITELAKREGSSVYAVKKILRGLKEKGYAKLVKIQNGTRWEGSEWVLFESPEEEESFRQVEFPTVGESHSQLQSTDCVQKGINSVEFAKSAKKQSKTTRTRTRQCELPDKQEFLEWGQEKTEATIDDLFRVWDGLQSYDNPMNPIRNWRSFAHGLIEHIRRSRERSEE